mgnify:CR=1 FL=1
MAKVPLVLGERVRLNGLLRWGIVVAWPPDAVEDLLRLQNSHVAVRPELSEADEQIQYWPRKEVRRDGEPDHGPPKPRPFYAEV